MAIIFKRRRIATLVLVVIVGLLVGSYLNTLIAALLPQGNVIKMCFTSPITFGVGDFAQNKPLLIDLDAIKFQFGFQLKLSLLSIVGIAIGLYLFRWYE